MQKMPPQKNPYLTQYKENVSNQQKLIRQRLGQSADDDNSINTHRYQTHVKSSSTQLVDPHNDGDFPSIDDETIVDAPSDDRGGKQKSRYSYFDHDAEESLQFFKKNLLPQSNTNNSSSNTNGNSNNNNNTTTTQRTLKTSSTATITRPVSTAFDRPLGTTEPKSTSNLFDRQPSLSSIKAGESVYVSRSRAPLEVVETSRTTASGNYKYPPNTSTSMSTTTTTTKPRSLPTVKQQHQQSSTPPRTRPLSISEQVTTAPVQPTVPQARNRANGATTTSQQKLKSTGSSSSRPLSGTNLYAADEVELARVNHHRAVSSNSPQLPESPIPAETFARKPLYNSLLRAHDSIRLKVNRPKIRPKSEPGQPPSAPVQDTQLDDTIELAEINNDNQEPGLNERAVDVKRRSSRKKGKSKKKDAGGKSDEQEQDDQQQQQLVPTRNFSEFRVVKVVRSESERSLGVTVRAEDGNIVVARILAGSLADKQGALQVGDVILAVNNREVYTPEQLQEQLRRTMSEDTVLLKIVPSFREELPTLCIYLRALFNYDPNEDSLLPCKEVGVAFNQGDILEVVNQEDPNWWQARRVDSENLQTGLIPSQELEERRRAFVIPDYDLATRTSICGTKVSRKSKKKEIYNVGQNCDFDKAELQLYEEVCRTPAFERRTLVLIGANGVGKQALKARLINLDPDRFGTPLPHTSRLPREGEEDGIHYHFVTREKMEEDIIAGKYLEYGEYDGALYGTKLDSVREIIGSGRICVLDCSPTCLKVLKTSDYLPFVAFIAAPTLDQLRYLHEWNRGNKTYATFDRALSRQSRRAKTLQDFAFDFFEDEDLQLTVEESARLFRIYENYFDIVLVNNDFNRTFEQLREAIDALSMAPQWIPISWIYGT
uniref:MAGUK p55 subfamily member 6 n=1 Tax=Aceria tosichella TaxID=561515 RepID=A0A6G1SED9_9ACAR